MKKLHTFESFVNESLNEANSTFIEDEGSLKTKLGNLKYVVKGGLDRGGNRGSYQIEEDKLSKLIGSIDTKLISKILGEKGIELDSRPSEFELNLFNSGLGHNGLSAITPEIYFPVNLSKDYPKKQNGWATSNEEYAIYKELNNEFEKSIKSKTYRLQFASEYSPSIGCTIKADNSKVIIYFEQGSLA